jgi:alkyldihydroxyacetonephosphate synthase
MSERRRKFWGWGYADQVVPEAEAAEVVASAARRFGVDDLPGRPPPGEADIPLRAPRVRPPASLAPLMRDDAHERLVHAYGKSFPDAVRMFRREVPNPPDLVAYPASAAEAAALLDWAGGAGVAVIPFGGGSSVVGGVEPDVGDLYAGTLSMDLGRLDGIREIDRVSRAALVEGGIRGPALEAALKPHGLTLRHFPQSFEHSTLGGWIATRSGGHFATRHTHIDDFVEALEVVTPAGRIETRRLPGSGAGPSPDRLFIGSEGALGVITAAWMRLQDVPRKRAAASVLFPDFLAGAEAVRAIMQSGLDPANCRLIDAAEAQGSGAGDGTQALLVLAFESAALDQSQRLAQALDLCRAAGGTWDDGAAAAPDAHRAGASGAWREAFIRAPFYREVLVPRGVIVDTFETAITWDRLPAFHADVTARMAAAIRRVTGRPGTVTCRFTHAYPDGPAPYFTFQALGTWDGLMEQWRALKAEASDAVIDGGGTITHHHAVGRDHDPWYRHQRPALVGAALAAAKQALDPVGILNPGVIVDPVGRAIMPRGAMAAGPAPSLKAV